jgi:hypothetical protein
MKRLLRVFELTKNEQRVVLIVMLTLISIAFVRYERRIHRAQLHPPTPQENQASPSPLAEDKQ